MIMIALDFWSIVVYAFVASVLFIGYRLTWRLAYLSEGLIISLARGGPARPGQRAPVCPHWLQ
jgi:hypothetical protein